VIVRGNCERIRPPASVAAARRTTEPFLAAAATGALLFVGLVTPPTFSCSLYEE
jgi:hypothetical protein